MKITDWVQEDAIPLLTWLGKHDWLEITPIEDGKSRIVHTIPDLPDSMLAHEPLLDSLHDASQIDLLKLFSDSKWLGHGPKLIRPTYDQCLALENVELNIGFSDYKQPYPVLLVELPQAYRDDLSERFGFPCPQGAMCHHDERSGYILCHSGKIDGIQVVDIMPPRPYFDTVEAALNAPSDTGPDIEQSKTIQRVAMNICLMLVNLGVRQVGPSDPDRLSKLRNVRGSKKRMAEAKRRLQSDMPTIVTFAQEIDFFDRGDEPSHSGDADSIATGRHNKPHWRKGHFRKQRYGRGWSLTRLQFIKPVLVNSKFFAGDLGNTAAVYRGK